MLFLLFWIDFSKVPSPPTSFALNANVTPYHNSSVIEDDKSSPTMRHVDNNNNIPLSTS